MAALKGSRVGSLGSKMVAVVAVVAAAVAAGGISVCSVFVASCGNMAHQRTAPGAADHGVGSEGALRVTRLGQWQRWSK